MLMRKGLQVTRIGNKIQEGIELCVVLTFVDLIIEGSFPGTFFSFPVVFNQQAGRHDLSR